MKNANRSLLFFGLASAGLGAGAIVVGMTNYRPDVPETVLPSPKPKEESSAGLFSSKAINAKNALAENLMRRFTDRQNVDFGISRLVQPETRLHEGPTMDKFGFHKWRRKGEDGHEAYVEGRWIDGKLVKPSMRPENESEKLAIQGLKDENVDVAIYTVGQFNKDTGEKPVPRKDSWALEEEHYQGFSWEIPNSIRAKGPAYVSQEAEKAPRSYEMVEFGRKAWASGKETFFGEEKGGWKLFASRVNAPDMSCAKCHSDTSVKTRVEFLKDGSGPKAGDGIGIFIIALRQR